MSEHIRPTLTVERREAIADLVVQEGTARVAQLAKHFDVSTATIRRDLETLEERGAVQRVHGGAIAARGEPSKAAPSAPFASSQAARIGQTVVEMIEDGETIFLGPGSLSLEVARRLEDRSRVTVITNDLEVAHWLANHSRHRLIVTGGQLEGHDSGLVGQLTIVALSTLRADSVILELGGVSAVEGLTEDSLPQAEVAELLMDVGSTVMIVVPAERVGRVAAAPVAPVTAADVIVTAREAPSAYLWDLSETGVQIVLA